jgi:hypothetical protein
MRASLSLDLDNAWSYLKTRGDESWVDLPSYLPTVVPRALELLDDLDQRITFFIVGTDAEAEPEQIKALSDAGHEIGNHSHRHEPWLHRYGHDELEHELDQAEDAIEAACGTRPTAFRGPGYSVTPALLESLARRGYTYDCSLLPTWIGPLARAYYFRTASLAAEEREERAALFGSLRDGAQPLRSFQWNTPAGAITEIPVTTFPLLRIPCHVSYVLYLERLSPRLARAYFRAALATCARRGVAPSILLHPLDLIGADDDVPEGLRFFPGMDLPGARKRALVRDCVAMLRDRFDVVPVGEHAAAAAEGARVRLAR